MLTAILAALKFAPTMLGVGKQIYESVTGQKTSDDETPETLAAKIDELPEDARAAVSTSILAYKEHLQELDTARFSLLTDGDAEKVKSTARPEIARRAMGVIEIFSKCFMLLIYATIAEWLLRTGFGIFNKPFPVTDSLWDIIADAAPVTEMIWGPLIMSFGVCASVIKKYMGCRERDKAQEYEIRRGAPLSSAAATIEAAGGGVASLIKAFRK